MTTRDAFEEVRDALGLTLPLLAPVVDQVKRAGAATGQIGFQLAQQFHAILRGSHDDLMRQLDPYVSFPGGPEYRRVWLFWEPGVCELQLLCWNPGASTPIHNHAESEGVDCVVDGCFFEDTFSVHENGSLGQRAERIHDPGSAIFLGLDLVHKMTYSRVGNPEGRGGRTLHLYYPAVDMGRVTVYGSGI